MDIANVWLQSGLPASIRGARLLPIVHTRYENLAHREEGAQGEAYHLIQETHKREWILKKFKKEMQPDRKYLVSIRSLVPRVISCMTATKRLVLNQEDLKHGESLYTSNDLAKWLQNTILMPKVPGKSWKEATEGIRKGELSFNLYQRSGFAKSLANTIAALEDNGCAHRDLSQHNVFMDLREYIIYLVDWDSLFHGSLYFHKNTTPGTEGYIAPWVIKDGEWDARKSWHRKADRFSLAIMIAEFLLVDTEAPSYYEGALFSQEMYGNANHPYLNRVRKALNDIYEPLADLFNQTLNADNYDECPSPINWVEALDVVEAQAEEEFSENIIEEEFSDGEEELVVGTTQAEDSEKRSFGPVHYILIIFILLTSIALAEVYQRKKHKRSLWAVLTNRTGQSAVAEGEGLRDGQLESETQQNTETEKEETIAQNESIDENGELEPIIEEQPPGNLGNEENNNSAITSKSYDIEIRYSGYDLTLLIDQQEQTLTKQNTAQITLEPGEHEVTLVYTGVVKLPNGDQRPDTNFVSQSQKIKFDDNTNIVFQINREKKTWYVDF